MKAKKEYLPRSKLLLRLSAALSPVHWIHKLDFTAVCPCCNATTADGKPKKTLRIRQSRIDTGYVDGECKACGADIDAVCAAVGIRKGEIEVAALEVIGANRCTTCEHYASERTGGRVLYGCKVKNLYRFDELWEISPGDTTCTMYQTDRKTLLRGLEGLDANIEQYRTALEELERRKRLIDSVLTEI